MTGELPKWSVLDGTVTGHRPYGLLVQVPSGETGVVDRALIADSAVATADWPVVGSAITVVVEGYTGAGQLRLSARASHRAQAAARSAEPAGRIREGMVAVAEVVAHHPWGIDVRLLPPNPEVVGVVDVIQVTDERPFAPFADYPHLGWRLDVVVLGYTPNGQLRLSTRSSELDRARNQASGNGDDRT
jgi:predicted RNA-binding protein with RPS1 domain